MRFSRIAPFLFLAFFLVSCMPQQPDVDAIRKTIEEFDAASKDAMMGEGKDMDKVMSYYAEDAVSMPPNMAPLKGREAIRSWMNQMMQSGMKMTSVKFSTSDLDAGGKVAYQVGSYEMAMEVPGMGEIMDDGKYLSVWKQQQDGSWKVHAEIWNTNKPMPPMEKPKEEKKKK